MVVPTFVLGSTESKDFVSLALLVISLGTIPPPENCDELASSIIPPEKLRVGNAINGHINVAAISSPTDELYPSTIFCNCFSELISVKSPLNLRFDTVIPITIAITINIAIITANFFFI